MGVLYPKEIPNKETCLGEELAGMCVRQFIWTKEKTPSLRVQQWHNFAFQFAFRVADLPYPPPNLEVLCVHPDKHKESRQQDSSVMCRYSLPTRPDRAK